MFFILQSHYDWRMKNSKQNTTLAYESFLSLKAYYDWRMKNSKQNTTLAYESFLSLKAYYLNEHPVLHLCIM
jgi:hypothetical protein